MFRSGGGSDHPKVALLQRGRGNKAEIRAVDVHEEKLQQAWREQRAREQMEREHLKRLTLAHSERQVFICLFCSHDVRSTKWAVGSLCSHFPPLSESLSRQEKHLLVRFKD